MTSRFKTIVAPSDFSESSRNALHYALEMVADGGTIIVCHVVDDIPLTYGYVGLAMPPGDLRSRMATEAREELVAFVPVLKEGQTVETVVLHGSPSVEIVNLATERHADLVVMGTHGRTGLQHALLGSVAEKVTRKSPCPVLVVREGAAREET